MSQPTGTMHPADRRKWRQQQMRRTVRSLVGVITLACLLVPLPAQADSTTVVPAANPNIVITDVLASVLATSAQFHRVLIAGQDTANGTPATTYQGYGVTQLMAFELLDAANYRVITKQATGGQINAAAIDDNRGLAYLTVGTASRRTGLSRSFRLELWAVDLRTGRVQSKTLFYEGETATVTGLAVVTTTGIVIVTTSHVTTTTYDLFRVDPRSSASYLTSLAGSADHFYYDDSLQTILIVHEQANGADTEAITAYDARNGVLRWRYAGGLLATGFSTDVTSLGPYQVAYNARTHVIWYRAPANASTPTPGSLGLVNK